MLIVLDKQKLNTTRWELMKFNIKGQSEEMYFWRGVSELSHLQIWNALERIESNKDLEALSNGTK